MATHRTYTCQQNPTSRNWFRKKKQKLLLLCKRHGTYIIVKSHVRWSNAKQPAVNFEPGTLKLWNCTPTVQWSTFADWTVLVRLKDASCENIWSLSEPVCTVYWSESVTDCHQPVLVQRLVVGIGLWTERQCCKFTAMLPCCSALGELVGCESLNTHSCVFCCWSALKQYAAYC